MAQKDLRSKRLQVFMRWQALLFPALVYTVEQGGNDLPLRTGRVQCSKREDYGRRGACWRVHKKTPYAVGGIQRGRKIIVHLPGPFAQPILANRKLSAYFSYGSRRRYPTPCLYKTNVIHFDTDPGGKSGLGKTRLKPNLFNSLFHSNTPLYNRSIT